MAARTRRGTIDRPWDEGVRSKIQVSMLINRLHDHIFGDAEVSVTQMKAIEILLRKKLPDLSAMEHSGSIGNTPVERLTDAELDAELAELRAQRAAIAGGQAPPDDPTQLH